MRRRNQKGFTLIELMVVITIIGLLASVAAVGVMGNLRKAKVETTKTSMRNIQEAIKMYYLDHNTVPDSLSQLCGPDDDSNRRLDMEEPPKDGWNNEFVYSRRDKRNYDLMSYGADGAEGGQDEDQDITRADLNKRGDENEGKGN